MKIQEYLTKKYFILAVALNLADLYSLRIEHYDELKRLDTLKRVNYKLAMAYIHRAIDRRYHSFANGQDIIDSVTRLLANEKLELKPLEGLRVSILIMYTLKEMLKKYQTKSTDKKFFLLIEQAYNEISTLINTKDEEMSIVILDSIEDAMVW